MASELSQAKSGEVSLRLQVMTHGVELLAAL